MSYKKYAEDLGGSTAVNLVREPFPFEQVARNLGEHMDGDDPGAIEVRKEINRLRKLEKLSGQVIIEVVSGELTLYDPMNKYQSAKLEPSASRFQPIVSVTASDGQKTDIDISTMSVIELWDDHLIYLPDIPRAFLDTLYTILDERDQDEL